MMKAPSYQNVHDKANPNFCSPHPDWFKQIPEPASSLSPHQEQERPIVLIQRSSGQFCIEAIQDLIEYAQPYLSMLLSILAAFILGITIPWLIKKTYTTFPSLTAPYVNPNSSAISSNFDERFNRLSIAIEKITSTVKKHEEILGVGDKRISKNEIDPLVNSFSEGKIVRVNVPKANLRIGPDLNAPIATTVDGNTLLVVDKEDGGWLRVFAPNGELLWIFTNVVESSE